MAHSVLFDKTVHCLPLLHGQGRALTTLHKSGEVLLSECSQLLSRALAETGGERTRVVKYCLLHEWQDKVNELIRSQYLEELLVQGNLDGLRNLIDDERANFAKSFDKHHWIVIEITAFNLSDWHLTQDHHECLIKHLFLEQILDDRPL